MEHKGKDRHFALVTVLPSSCASQADPGDSGRTSAIYTLWRVLTGLWVFGKENQAISSGLVLKLRQNSKRRWEPWAPRKCYIYKAPAPPTDSEMPTTPSEQSSKEQTMQSVIPGEGPWQGCAPLSTHLCLLWKSAAPVKSSKLPRTQVLLMLDCSPAWQNSNRVTNTTANLSSSGEQGFRLTGSIQQLLLFCYFQTSSCRRWSSRRALCCPLLPLKSNFPGQGTSPGHWERSAGSLHSSHLISSALAFRTQHLKGETKWCWSCLGDFSSNIFMALHAQGLNWIGAHGQKEKTVEDEMVEWHRRLNGHEFEQTPGDGKG